MPIWTDVYMSITGTKNTAAPNIPSRKLCIPSQPALPLTRVIRAMSMPKAKSIIDQNWFESFFGAPDLSVFTGFSVFSGAAF